MNFDLASVPAMPKLVHAIIRGLSWTGFIKAIKAGPSRFDYTLSGMMACVKSTTLVGLLVWILDEHSKIHRQPNQCPANTHSMLMDYGIVSGLYSPP